MTDTLAVDPGIRGCGVALFIEGKLLEATYIKNPVKKGNDPEVSANMAYEVFAWYCTQIEKFPVIDIELLLEKQQTYGGKAARGDANDLFPLAAINGALVAYIKSRRTISYFPREWKGNVNADIMIERIKSRLTTEEMSTVMLTSAKSLHHNIWDAVGIGLYHLCRLEKTRIIHRE